jgi:SAM-dependent methyltransferase
MKSTPSKYSKYSKISKNSIDDYFSGSLLYGDDFSEAQLHAWYEEEKEGYSGVVLSHQDVYQYHYHELNIFHLFNNVMIPMGANAIGLGSAFGDEFIPIAERLSKITIIDPSDKFAEHEALNGTPLEYRKPNTNGWLDFPDNHFQIATSLGALHHIANVTAVLREFYRCLIPGRYMLIREPIVTQGDWRYPGRGLTKNERGIPYELFRMIVTDLGFRIEHSALFDFAPYTLMMAELGKPAFTNSFATRVDRLLSLIFSFNTNYHRTNFIQRFGPASVALVLRKPSI